jgi:hypothetical protein
LPAHTRDRASHTTTRASHKKGRAKEEGGPKEITCLPAGRGQQQLVHQRWELIVDADLAVDELLQLQRMEEPRRRPGDAGDGDGGGPGRPLGCRRWTSSNSGMASGAGAAAGDGGQAEQERQLWRRRGDVRWRRGDVGRRSSGGSRSALTLARIPFYPTRTAADSHAHRYEERQATKNFPPVALIPRPGLLRFRAPPRCAAPLPRRLRSACTA